MNAVARIVISHAAAGRRVDKIPKDSLDGTPRTGEFAKALRVQGIEQVHKRVRILKTGPCQRNIIEDDGALRH
jgi:hypothetical protein